MTPSINKSMESPWVPQCLLALSLSPPLSPFLHGFSYGCLYAWLTLRRYHLLPFIYNDPLPAWSLSQFTCSYLRISIISLNARKNVRSFNIESHRLHKCQAKNNPMRHEESRDVDCTGNKKACTTRSHIWSSPEVSLPILLLLSHLKLTTPCSSLSLTVPTFGDDCRSHSLQESSSSFWTLSVSQRW